MVAAAPTPTTAAAQRSPGRQTHEVRQRPEGQKAEARSNETTIKSEAWPEEATVEAWADETAIEAPLETPPGIRPHHHGPRQGVSPGQLSKPSRPGRRGMERTWVASYLYNPLYTSGPR